MRKLSKLATAVFAIATAGALINAPHASAVGPVGSCGAYVTSVGGLENPHLFYNHCGTGNVKIRVDRTWAAPTEQCVGPGVTDLGNSGLWFNHPKDAYYIGNC